MLDGGSSDSSDASDSRAPRRLVAGATWGVGAALVVLCARWCTTDPFDAPVVVVDAVALVAAASALALIVPSRWAARVACGAVAAIAGHAWVHAALPHSGPLRVALLALGAAAALAALVALGAADRSRRAGIGPGAWGVALAGGLTIAIAGGEWHRIAGIAGPLALGGLAWAGSPRSRASVAAPVAWLVAFVAAGHVLAPLAPRRAARVPAAAAVAPARPRASAVGGPDAPASRGDAVVLIVLDTLRRDRLSLYGYGRATTPAIDAWARDGLVFEEAMSTAPWTLPSHASLFTGLYPRAHGAHGYRGSEPAGNATPLDARFDTIAELAARAGVETGGIAANHFYVSSRFGLDQGFATWFAEGPRTGLSFGPLDAIAARAIPASVWRERHAYYEASHVTDLALDWLRAVGSRPFLLFVNYFDVHEPTDRPPTALAPLESERPLDEAADEEIAMLAGREPLDPDVVRYWSNNYDRELERLDREVGRLLAFVEASGLAARTTVFLTADHGEYLGEHGLVGHELDVHREVVDVPLVVRGPGIAAGRSAQPVSLVDVAPSVLERLGLALPPVEGAQQGVSLFGDEGEGAAAPELVAEWYPSASSMKLDPRLGGRFDRAIRVLRRGTLDLFVDDRGARMLFDRADDPGQMRDVAPARPDDVRALGAAFARWEARNAPAQDEEGRARAGVAAPLDAAELERLRELGYAP
ncbi:MAG: sulfatase [Myxococcota bacterium]